MSESLFDRASKRAYHMKTCLWQLSNLTLALSYKNLRAIIGCNWSQCGIIRPHNIFIENCTNIWQVIASSPGPSLRGRRARYTLTAHVPICTQNLGTSYMPIKYSVNYLFTITSSSQFPRVQPTNTRGKCKDFVRVIDRQVTSKMLTQVLV